MNVGNGSIQVIDEHKAFNADLLSYLSRYYRQEDDSGLRYHIVSVFGSQSTGKSTLLNHLFGTQFDVMNETQRQQTTKGIWLAHANSISNSKGADSSANGEIFVMDVEGTDGRERGEDQDFERKSALFALSTSEVLIVNIWEHQVGLYQGANMGLLKTVFEVNLSLFAENRQKSCLLFVIRDHIGVTPLENLSTTLTEDLNKIWDQLSKPAGTESSAITDFFDLKFWALPHKLLQNDKFLEGVSELGDSFLQEEQLFQKSYHRNIPIDGWSMYAEQVWEQIELNKDLDLPTQQILVARFRCDEIANEAYKTFETQFQALEIDDNLKALGSSIQQLRDTALAEYDTSAARYTNTVYSQRRKLLIQKLDAEIKKLHSNVMDFLKKTAVDKFVQEVGMRKKVKGTNFVKALTLALDETLIYFNEESKAVAIKDDEGKDIETFNAEQDLVSLTAQLAELSNKEKDKELETVVSRIVKKFASSIKEIVVDNLSDPTEDSWDKILDAFNSTIVSLTSKYRQGDLYDFELELSAELNTKTYNVIRSKCWGALDSFLHDYITEDTVLNILKNKFDEFFRYDEKGLPKLWESTTEIDTYFTEARTKTLSLLPVFSLAKTSDNVEIIPDVEPEDDEDEDDDPDSEPHQFAHLLTFKQEQSISSKFKRQIDLIYTDAKRSIVQSRTSIPVYFYLLLLALGWNELMAVLRSPILFTFLLLLLAGAYVAYNLQMLGPIMRLSMAMYEQTKNVAKEKLKEILVDESPQASRPSNDEEK